MKNLLVVVALLAACGPKTPVEAAPVPAPVEAAPAVAAAATVEATAAATAEAAPPVAMLAPAFDAETLHKGLKAGTVIRYEMSADFQEGSWIEEWTVTAADAAGCTIKTKKFGPDGVTVAEEDEHTQTWAELSSHGTYVAAHTTRTDSTIDYAGKPIPTAYYEQTGIDEEGTVVKTHFSAAHVGPPVWTEMRVGDKVIFAMHMLSYTAP